MKWAKEAKQRMEEELKKETEEVNEEVKDATEETAEATEKVLEGEVVEGEVVEEAEGAEIAKDKTEYLNLRYTVRKRKAG